MSVSTKAKIVSIQLLNWITWFLCVVA